MSGRMLCVLSGSPSAAGFMFRTFLATLVPAVLPCQVLNSRLLQEAFLDPYVPSGQPVHRFMDYRLQASVVSDRLVSRNACVRLFSGPFWQCFGRDFDLDLIPSPNPCASLRFEGPNPNLQSPVQHPSQDTRFREKPTLASGPSQEATFLEKPTLATCPSQKAIFQEKPTLATALFSYMMPHATELPRGVNSSSAVCHERLPEPEQPGRCATGNPLQVFLERRSSACDFVQPAQPAYLSDSACLSGFGACASTRASVQPAIASDSAYPAQSATVNDPSVAGAPLLLDIVHETTAMEANVPQAGQPCDACVPRCMPSGPSSSPLVALGFRPDSAVQPPLVLGTVALGPSSPLSVAIGFRPDSAVQPPLVLGTVSDSVFSCMLPQAAEPLHNVNSSCVVPSLRAHRAGAEADCGMEFPSFEGQDQLSSELPAPSASFPTADPNFILQRGDWQELHPDSCVTPRVCSVCQQEPVLGLAVDQEVQEFMQACSTAHQVTPREELHVAMHDAMSYCPHCLCVWEASLRKYRQHVAAHAELSGPSYFIDFEEAQELDDQDGSARLLWSEQVPQMQAKAVSGCGCRLGVPSSRRARRRYNHRLRRDAANQYHRVSLDSLIEPLLLEQGAPKTPEEEVTTGSREFCQGTCRFTSLGTRLCVVL